MVIYGHSQNTVNIFRNGYLTFYHALPNYKFQITYTHTHNSHGKLKFISGNLHQTQVRNMKNVFFSFSFCTFLSSFTGGDGQSSLTLFCNFLFFLFVLFVNTLSRFTF